MIFTDPCIFQKFRQKTGQVFVPPKTYPPTTTLIGTGKRKLDDQQGSLESSRSSASPTSSPSATTSTSSSENDDTNTGKNLPQSPIIPIPLPATVKTPASMLSKLSEEKKEDVDSSNATAAPAELLSHPKKRARREHESPLCKTAINRITKAFEDSETVLDSEVNSQLLVVENLFKEKKSSVAAELLGAISVVLGESVGSFTSIRDQALRECAELWMTILLDWNESVSERKSWNDKLKKMLTSEATATTTTTVTTKEKKKEKKRKSKSTKDSQREIPSSIISQFEDAAWIALVGWEDEGLTELLKDDSEKKLSKEVLKETPGVIKARVQHLRRRGMLEEAGRLEKYYLKTEGGEDLRKLLLECETTDRRKKS